MSIFSNHFEEPTLSLPTTWEKQAKLLLFGNHPNGGCGQHSDVAIISPAFGWIWSWKFNSMASKLTNSSIILKYHSQIWNNFYNLNSFKMNSFMLYSLKMNSNLWSTNTASFRHRTFFFLHVFKTTPLQRHVLIVSTSFVLFHFCSDTSNTGETRHYFMIYCVISIMYVMTLNCKQ